MIYGIDIGAYTKNIEWSLLKQKGVEFTIIKATQGDYRYNKNLPAVAAAARQAGIATGLYHWCDPIRDGKTQGEYFLKKTSGTEFDFVALDFEQYWANWSEWPGKVKTLLSPAKISKAGLATLQAMQNGLGGKKVLVYTRTSFIDEYALPALDWLANYPLWIAHWAYPAGSVTITWEKLLEQYACCKLEPALPKDVKQWTFHQWSGDRYILPGMNNEKADLNCYAGTASQLRTWLGLEPETIFSTAIDPLAVLQEKMAQLLQQTGELNTTLQDYVTSQKSGSVND